MYNLCTSLYICIHIYLFIYTCIYTYASMYTYMHVEVSRVSTASTINMVDRRTDTLQGKANSLYEISSFPRVYPALFR